MIMTRQVKKSMKNEVGYMMIERDAFFRSFARAGFVGQRNIADHLGWTRCAELQQIFAR